MIGYISGTFKSGGISDVPKIPVPKNVTVKRPKDAVKLASFIAEQYQEYGIVITLTPRLKVTAIRIVAIGCVDEATADIRDLLRGAIIDNAYGIIFVHNHPSGDLKPSKADKKLLKSLYEAGNLLNIEIVDAIIISGKKWRSIITQKKHKK